MAKAEENKAIIAGLDIGTTKVVCAIATVSENSSGKDEIFDIVGVGTSPNTGMRQGIVVNIESTIESIRRAREEAELMSGYNIDEVLVGISGAHIKSFDSKGMVAIRSKEVGEEDIERVLEAAKAVVVPSDREVVHVLPREYKVDEQEGILDPIGMSGVRLEASVHIITGGVAALENSIKCTEKAGLKVGGLVLQQLASGLSILSEDEKNLGVAVVDMGGGTSDLVMYTNGSVSHTSVVPVGGAHFTHDVAVGLRTPQTSAEELKKKHGAALVDMVKEDELIDVPGVGGREPRSLQRRSLCEVIEPRAEETLALINEKIQSSGLSDLLGSGIVLTGGASQLTGLSQLGEYVFDVPVRMGAPLQVNGLSDVVKSPAYSTAIGLIIYGLQRQRKTFVSQEEETSETGVVGGWTRKFKELLGGAF